MTSDRWRTVTVGVAAAAAALLGVPNASSALADTVATPTGLSASFAGWSSGLVDVSVSWTPQVGVGGYEVADSTTPAAPAPPGKDVPGSASDSTTLSVTSSGGPLTVSLWAYTGTSAADASALSQPATTTVDVPDVPGVIAVPVSGARGKAELSWSAPTFAGDAIVVRQGPGAANGPTGGTAVPVAAGQSSAVITGLPDLAPSNNDPVAVYELQGGDPAKWSPASTTLAYAAPAPTLLGNQNPPTDPSHLVLTWGAWGCNIAVAGQSCNLDVVENPGNKVAASPTDGKLEDSGLGLRPNATITDLVLGDTYTFTLFNVVGMGSEFFWSIGSSATVKDVALPTISLSAPRTKISTSQHVTLTAKLKTVGTNPTGTVTFDSPYKVLCKKVPLTAAHVVHCRTTGVAISAGNAGFGAGPAVFARYSGDRYDASNDTELDLTISRVAAKISVRVAGQHRASATVTATVTGPAGPATGVITMLSGTKKLCTETLTHASATCTLTARRLGAGKHAVTIRYGGSSSYRSGSEKTTLALKG